MHMDTPYPTALEKQVQPECTRHLVVLIPTLDTQMLAPSLTVLSMGTLFVALSMQALVISAALDTQMLCIPTAPGMQVLVPSLPLY